MTDNEPTSWRALTYGTPVKASDGTTVGTVREVLGSDGEDIFHGLRIALGGNADLMLPSEDVTSMTTSEVGTDLTPDAIRALPAYDESATYHLASVGWLRRHLGWTEDSKSDEEPG